jgi:hypothetical protein
MAGVSWADEMTAWSTLVLAVLAATIAVAEWRRYRLARKHENDRVMREWRSKAALVWAEESEGVVTIHNYGSHPVRDVRFWVYGVESGGTFAQHHNENGLLLKPGDNHSVEVVPVEHAMYSPDMPRPDRLDVQWAVSFLDHDMNRWWFDEWGHLLLIDAITEWLRSDDEKHMTILREPPLLVEAVFGDGHRRRRPLHTAKQYWLLIWDWDDPDMRAVRGAAKAEKATKKALTSSKPSDRV